MNHQPEINEIFKEIQDNNTTNIEKLSNLQNLCEEIVNTFENFERRCKEIGEKLNFGFYNFDYSNVKSEEDLDNITKSVKMAAQNIRNDFTEVATLCDNLEEYIDTSPLQQKTDAQKHIFEKLVQKNSNIIQGLNEELNQHKELSDKIDLLGSQLQDLHREIDGSKLAEGKRYDIVSDFKREIFTKIDSTANKIPSLENSLTNVSSELRSNVFSTELKSNCTKLRKECAAVTTLVMAKRGKYESALVSWESFEKDLVKVQKLINSCEDISSLVSNSSYTSTDTISSNDGDDLLEKQFSGLISKVQDSRNSIELLKEVPIKLANLTDDVIDSDSLENRLSQLILLIDELPDELASKLSILRHSKNGQLQLCNTLEDMELWLNAFTKEETNATADLDLSSPVSLDKNVKQVQRLVKMLKSVEQRIVASQQSEFLTDSLVDKLENVQKIFTATSDRLEKKEEEIRNLEEYISSLKTIENQMESMIENLEKNASSPENYNIEDIRDGMVSCDASLDVLGSEITVIKNDLLNVGIQVDLKNRFENAKVLYQKLKNNSDGSIKQHLDYTNNVHQFNQECEKIYNELLELHASIEKKSKKLYNLEDLILSSTKSKFVELSEWQAIVKSLQSKLDMSTISSRNNLKSDIYTNNKELIENILKLLNDHSDNLQKASRIYGDYSETLIIVDKFLVDSFHVLDNDCQGSTVEMSSKLVTYEALLNNVEQKLTLFNKLSTCKSELIVILENNENKIFEIQDNTTLQEIAKTTGEKITSRQELINKCFALMNKTKNDLELQKSIQDFENTLYKFKEKSDNLDKAEILTQLSLIETGIAALPDHQNVIIDLPKNLEALNNDLANYKGEVEELLTKESSISAQMVQLAEYIDKFRSWLDNIQSEISELKDTQDLGPVKIHQQMYDFNKKMLSQRPHITSTYDRILELSKNADDFKNTTNKVFNLLNKANQLQSDFETTCKSSADTMKDIEEALYNSFNNDSKAIFNEWNKINAEITGLEVTPKSILELDEQILVLGKIEIPENSIATDYLLLSPKGKYYEDVKITLENLEQDYEKLIESLKFVKNEKKLAKDHLSQVENKRSELEKKLNIVSNMMEKLIVYGKNKDQKSKKIYSLEKVRDSLCNQKTDFDDLLQIASLLGADGQTKSVEVALRKAHRLIAQYHNKEREVKEAIHKAQTSLQAHESYLSYYDEFDEWIRQMNTELNNSTTSEAIEKLQITPGTVKLSILQGRSQKCLNLTHPDGQHDIKEKTKIISEEFDKLCDNLHGKRSSIELHESELQNELDIINEFKNWFEDISKLINDIKSDSVEISKLRTLLYELCEREEEITSAGKDHPFYNEYKNLIEITNNRIQKAESVINQTEKHTKVVKECSEWIENINDELNRWTSVSNMDREILERKLEKVESLKVGSLPNGKSLIERLKIIEEEMFIHPSEIFISMETDYKFIKSSLENASLDANTALTQLIQYNERLGIAKKLLLVSLDKFKSSIESIKLPSVSDEQTSEGFDQDTIIIQKCLSTITDLHKFGDLADELRHKLNEMCRIYNDSDNADLSEVVMTTLKDYEGLQIEVNKLYNGTNQNLRAKFSTLYRSIQAELRSAASKLEDYKTQTNDSVGEDLGKLKNTTEKSISKSLEALFTSGELVNNCLMIKVKSSKDISHNQKLQNLISTTKSQMRSCKDSWKNLKEKFLDAIDSQQHQHDSIKEFEKLYLYLKEILNQWNDKLINLIGLQETLIEKEYVVNNLSELLETASNEASQFENRIISKSGKLDSEHSSNATKLHSKFRQFYSSLSENFTQSKYYLKLHRDFINEEKLIDQWLDENNDSIKKLSISSASEEFKSISSDIINNRLNLLREIQTNLQESEIKVSKLLGMSEKVFKTTSKEGRQKITDKINAIDKKYKQTLQSCNKLYQDLEELFKLVKQFSDDEKDYYSWKNDLGFTDVDQEYQSISDLTISEIKNHIFLINNLKDTLSKINEKEIISLQNYNKKYEAIALDYKNLLKSSEKKYALMLDRQRIKKETKNKNDEFISKFTNLKIGFSKMSEVSSKEDLNKKLVQVKHLREELNSLNDHLNASSIIDSNIITDFTNFSAQVEALITEYQELDIQFENFLKEIEQFKSWFSSFSKESNRILNSAKLTLSNEENDESVENIANLVTDSKEGTDILNNCSMKVRYLTKYPNLHCANLLTQISNKFTELTSNNENKFQFFVDSAGKIKTFNNNVIAANEMLTPFNFETDMDKVLLYINQADQSSKLISNNSNSTTHLSISSELENRLADLKYLYDLTLKKIQTRQSKIKADESFKKMKLDEFNENLSSYITWKKQIELEVDNLGKKDLLNTELYEKRSMLSNLSSILQEIGNYFVNNIEKLVAQEKELLLTEVVQGQQSEINIESITSLKEKCNNKIKKVKEFINIHLEFNKAMQRAEIAMLDLTAQSRQAQSSNQNKSIDEQLTELNNHLTEIIKTKPLLDEMKQYFTKLNGDDKISEDYENLMTTYNNQLNQTKGKINQLNETKRSELENNEQAVENWASNRMSDISNLKPTTMDTGRIVLEELKTSLLEVNANLENYPDNKLLNRLKVSIKEEVDFTEALLKDWEEAIYTLTKIDNWINKNGYESFASSLGDLDISRKLNKRRLLLQEIEKRQKIKFTSSAKENREIYDKQLVVNGKLSDLHSQVSTDIVELESRITLEERKKQLENSMNDQILRINTSVNALVKNSTFTLAKKISDSESLLGRLDNIEETLDYADNMVIEANDDSEHQQSLKKSIDNLTQLKTTLNDFLHNLRLNETIFNQINQRLSKIENFIIFGEEHYVLNNEEGLLDGIKLLELENKNAGIIKSKKECETYKTELLQNLMPVIEKGELSLLARSEMNNLNDKFSKFEDKLKSLYNDLIKSSSNINKKKDNRQYTIQSTLELEAWLVNELLKFENFSNLIPSDPDSLAAILRKHKESKDIIDTHKQMLEKVSDNKDIVDSLMTNGKSVVVSVSEKLPGKCLI